MEALLPAIGIYLHEFADPVLRDRGGNLLPVLRAPGHRFRKMNRLLRLDLGRHRRLVLVHHRFYQSRSLHSERSVDDPSRFRSLCDRKARQPETASYRRKVDWLQITLIFGVAKEDHLLPLDLAKGI